MNSAWDIHGIVSREPLPAPECTGHTSPDRSPSSPPCKKSQVSSLEHRQSKRKALHQLPQSAPFLWILSGVGTNQRPFINHSTKSPLQSQKARKFKPNPLCAPKFRCSFLHISGQQQAQERRGLFEIGDLQRELNSKDQCRTGTAVGATSKYTSAQPQIIESFVRCLLEILRSFSFALNKISSFFVTCYIEESSIFFVLLVF